MKTGISLSIDISRLNPGVSSRMAVFCWRWVADSRRKLRSRAARDFPGWQIIGADLCFDPYVVYDADDNYAWTE